MAGANGSLTVSTEFSLENLPKDLIQLILRKKPLTLKDAANLAQCSRLMKKTVYSTFTLFTHKQSPQKYLKFEQATNYFNRQYAIRKEIRMLSQPPSGLTQFFINTDNRMLPMKAVLALMISTSLLGYIGGIYYSETKGNAFGSSNLFTQSFFLSLTASYFCSKVITNYHPPALHNFVPIAGIHSLVYRAYESESAAWTSAIIFALSPLLTRAMNNPLVLDVLTESTLVFSFAFLVGGMATFPGIGFSPASQNGQLTFNSIVSHVYTWATNCGLFAGLSGIAYNLISSFIIPYTQDLQANSRSKIQLLNEEIQNLIIRRKPAPGQNS